MPDIIDQTHIEIVKKSLNEYAKLEKLKADIVFCQSTINKKQYSFEGRNASIIKTALLYYMDNGANSSEQSLINTILLQQKWARIDPL